MILETLFSKLLDIITDSIIKLFVYGFEIISPISIEPYAIIGTNADSDMKEILELRIKNRLNSSLYDIFVAGISKEEFDIRILSDSGTNQHDKSLEHSKVNPNRLVAFLQNTKNGEYIWILRIHRLNPREAIGLKIKVNNKKPILFKIAKHGKKELPIKESANGVVQIPFDLDDLAKKLYPKEVKTLLSKTE